MKSQRLGRSISEVEVLNISPRGVWLYAKGKEHFLSYEDFPWFKKATISQIHDVELCHNHYLRWRSLDIELELESLQNLDHYPLIYQ